jgi:farnesyl diphosphate synthase
MNQNFGDFDTWVRTQLDNVESALSSWVPGASAPAGLGDAMRYAVLDGGKRLRPLLVLAAVQAVDGECEAALRAACAVELIHAYSLVHDDMPCMDNDVLRRGKPTCHVEFDEATALLVGDALQPLAFQLMAEHVIADSSVEHIEMLKILACASGSRGMAGGQALDLAGVGKSLSLPELEHMHIHKTGALIRAAVMLGARCGHGLDAEHHGRLERYAETIGLAFQVVDDVLDCDASTATLGKTAGKDAAQDKPTYVSILGLARARELAEELRTEAHAALSSFGPTAVRLRELADFIVLRKF